MNLELRAIKRFMRKDEAGTDYVYKKTCGLVQHLCFDVLHDRLEAQDAAIETYIKVMESKVSFSSSNAFLCYLCKTAKTTALDMAKKNQEVEPLDEESVGVEEKQPTGLLQKAKALLDKDDYELVCLHLFHGLKFPAISMIQGGSASSCRGRYHRAMKTLRDNLRKEDYR